MKVFVSILLWVSLSLSAFAQKKSDCKFDIDKTDATGAPIRKIKTKLNGTDIFYIIISRNDTTYTLSLDFWISGTLKDVINKKDPLTIKLSGWQNLLLYNSQLVKPSMHYDDQTWTEYIPEFSIRAADLERIKTLKPLTLIMKVGIEVVSREFIEKDVEKILDIIKCIMK